MANQSVRIKISYDARKLENELKRVIVDKSIEDYANLVKDETIQGLEDGIDIRGRGFRKIEPVTRKIRKLRGHSGNKPLIASGDMKDSIKVIPWTMKKGGYKAKALRAESYGNSSNPNVHQTGFRLEGKQQTIKVDNEVFHFGRIRIPARPWFHNEESVEKSKKIKSGFEEIAKQYFRKFNRAFTK